MQRSIIFQTTSNIPGSLIAAANAGIEKAVSFVPKHLDRFRFEPARTPTTADGLIADMKVCGEGRQACQGLQLDASLLAKRLGSANTNPKDYWDVFLCNDDLMYQEFGWVFAVTLPEVPVSVLSVARFRNPRISNSQATIAVMRLLAHEVGHLLGLVERSHNMVDSYGKHCANVCIMRQAVTPLRWIKFAEEEKEQDVDFCSDCKQEMRERWSAEDLSIELSP